MVSNVNNTDSSHRRENRQQLDLFELDFFGRVDQVVVSFQVFIAHVLINFPVLRMIGIAINKPPRSLKDFWILQRCFNFESIDIDSPDPLDHMKILRMPERLVAISSASNSALIIEADSVDHQSITLPATNRIS